MCKPMSWIERENGKLLYLTNEQLDTAKGKRLIEYTGNRSDLQGHGAIRKYYGRSFDLPLDAGTNREETDFSSPASFPAAIIDAIKAGRFSRVWYGGDSLPGMLLSEAARQVCNEKLKAAWQVCNEKREDAWTVYDKKLKAVGKVCNEKREDAWTVYNEKLKAARQVYNEKREMAIDLFWVLFADPQNRAEPWR